MDSQYKVIMNDVRKITTGLGFGRMNKVQRFVDSTLAKDMDKYVPFDEGTLKNSVNGSRFGSGKLIYNTKYAKHQYQHGRDNGKRGAKWNERFMEREGKHFFRQVQHYVENIK